MEVGTISSWIQVGITGVGFLVAFFQWRNHRQLASANHLGEVLKIFCEEKNRLILDTTVTNQNGDVVIKGKATVMPPKAPAK